LFLKRLIRCALVGAFAHRGYELVPSWEIRDLPLVRHLRELFDLYNIDCVLDVGGNKGQFAKLLRQRVGFRGRIVTFEPVSAYVELLKRKSKDDELWTIVECALGRKPGEATINVTRSPGLNSFLAPSSRALEGFWTADAMIGTEVVAIRTLDEVLVEEGLRCDRDHVYLKLDTQGFDLEVLGGAANSLPYIKAMQTEASVLAIYEGMPTYADTIDAINRAGFELSGIFPVTHDQSLRLVEFDCVAVNSRLLPSAASVDNEVDRDS